MLSGMAHTSSNHAIPNQRQLCPNTKFGIRRRALSRAPRPDHSHGELRTQWQAELSIPGMIRRVACFASPTTTCTTTTPRKALRLKTSAPLIILVSMKLRQESTIVPNVGELHSQAERTLLAAWSAEQRNREPQLRSSHLARADGSCMASKTVACRNPCRWHNLPKECWRLKPFEARKKLTTVLSHSCSCSRRAVLRCNML